MKHAYVVLLVYILILAPSLSIGLSFTFNNEASDLEGGTVIQDDVVIDASSSDAIDLAMMFFTETPSSDNGFYFVCRRGTDAVAYFGASSVLYFSEGAVVNLEFPGSQMVIPEGEEPAGSVTNYLLGNNETSWKRNIVDCSILRYSEIYPGIDLVYRIQDGNLKYEFVVKPYADASIIRMSYPDADNLDVQTDSLSVSLAEFSVSDTGLSTFQEVERSEVPSSFYLVDTHTIGFDVGGYDNSKELFIDPLLVYSTYLGGIGDDVGTDIAVENGFIYVTGYTESSTFPMQNANDSTWGGGYDCFVTKISPDGQSLIYSTYLGSTYDEQALGIAVEDGYVYVTGYTMTATFPLVNAYDSSFAGSNEAFVTKLATDGQTLVYSTFLGGSNSELANGIAVENGYVAITGYTNSPDLPTYNAYNATFAGGSSYDCFVSLFAPNGSSVIYCTYLGGIGTDIGYGVDLEEGVIFVTGGTESSNFPRESALYDVFSGGTSDCFVTKFAADGQSLEYSTFLGGTSSDTAYEIAAENGIAYITGWTGSSGFPVAYAYQQNIGGGADAFLTKLSSDGQTLVYSTYYGGSSNEYPHGLAVENGYAYITGSTTSSFPMKNAYDSSYNGAGDCFVAKFAVDGQDLVYSTYLGGAGADWTEAVAVENSRVYVTGQTTSSDLPLVNSYDITFGGFSNPDCLVAVFIDDSDMDGLSNEDEISYGTNPFCIDTDNDNYNDGYEIAHHSDPLDAHSYPGATSPSDYDIAYSSYIGGSGSEQVQVVQVVDDYIYLAGYTTSANFPMVNAWNSTYSLTCDAFIIKLTPDGQSIVYSTYIGGINDDTLETLSVHEGCVFIGGYTNSPNFPTYLAYDATFNGTQDAFLMKLASDGSSPEFSTLLGGSSYIDRIYDLRVENGYIYVTGETYSTNFPTMNAYDSTRGASTDAFLSKFTPDGQSLVYSTYLGGNGQDQGIQIAVENGVVYISGMTGSSDFPLVQEFDGTFAGGSEGFLTKFAPDGKSIVLSSYIGGSNLENVQGMCVERGIAFLTGGTSSTDFPVVNALYPAYMGSGMNSGFLAKVNTNVSRVVYCTYLTGSGQVSPWAISVEDSTVCISGYTDSTDFPITAGHTMPCDPSSIDVFVTKFAPDGQSLLFSTCIGGTGIDKVWSIDYISGRLYIAGYTQSADFPCQLAYSVTAAGADDGFLAVYDIDSDGDSLPDFSESILGTDSLAIDSDNDNFLDAYEVAYGSDPNDALDYPAIPQAWYDAIYADLDGNASLIQNLIDWSNSNYSLLVAVMQQLDDNATLLIQVIAWLDGNHSAIETLFTQLDGNATLLLNTVNALNENSSLIENLLSWSAGNETLLLNVIDQVNALEPTDLTQILAWLDGNHTAIETLFTYVEGNATLLLSVIASVNANSAEMDVLAALISGNIILLNSINATHIEDFDELRGLVDELGISVGDTDYDGLDDLDELYYGTDPLCIDTDNDNLNDAFEIKLGTDPLDDDSDADTYLDGIEVIAGSDPLDPLSYPGSTQGIDPLVMMLVIGGIGGIAIVLIFVFWRKVRKS
ncbi:MAG: SBBP repeat-containing protein [Candidatus Thorarchaeota archaeon]